jgi:hypothetical protein
MKHIFLVLLLTTGCVTSAKVFEPAKVVERIGEKDETPAWAHAETAMQKDGADVLFVNSLSMAGDARTEACMKAAELDAKAAILRYVKDNVTTSGQLNEAAGDPAFEQLTAFLSQGQLSGVSTKARYWERREESDAAGERVLRTRCAAQVAIKRADLERQLQAAMGTGGNAEIREKLLKAQTDFIEQVGH